LLFASSATFADDCLQRCVDQCRPEYLREIQRCVDRHDVCTEEGKWAYEDCCEDARYKHSDCTDDCKLRECSNQRCIDDCKRNGQDRLNRCHYDDDNCIDLAEVDMDICIDNCRY